MVIGDKINLINQYHKFIMVMKFLIIMKIIINPYQLQQPFVNITQSRTSKFLFSI